MDLFDKCILSVLRDGRSRDFHQVLGRWLLSQHFEAAPCALIEPVWYFCGRGGFFVIPEYWLGTILGLIGCFAAFGVFRVSKYQRR